MLALKTYAQTGIYDPLNPNQRIREAYVPGGYASFYWNRQPNESSLKGLGTFTFAGLPGWAQLGIVAAIGAGAGYFAMSKWGSSIKPVMRKIPVVGSAFAGLGRARRRR